MLPGLCILSVIYINHLFTIHLASNILSACFIENTTFQSVTFLVDNVVLLG